MSRPARGGFRGLVRRGAFRDLIVGQTVSSLGDWMATVAFMAFTLELTDSPAAVGGILTLRLLPAAVGGPLAARAIRHWDRRRTMLAMDAARAVIVALVPLVAELWWVYLSAVLLEVASIVFLPARDASVPDLVERDDLPLANGLVLGASYGSIPIGAALFAAVAALPVADAFDRPFSLVFWVDAVSFLVSFVFISRLHALRAPVGATPVPERVRFRDAFRIPLVRAVMPAAAAVALGLGALFSMGIVFVQVVLVAGDAEFGVLIALFGAGAASGLAVLRTRAGHDPVRETRAGVIAIGAIVAGFSLTASIGLAFLGALLFGAAAAFTLASGMGALQSDLDGHERVLAFAAFHVVNRSALGAAAVAAGLIGEALGESDAGVVGSLEPARVVLLGSGVIVLAASLSVRTHRRAPLLA